MRKLDFINELRGKLSGLPKREVEERLNFYSEMIDDRMEEGFSEEEAVSEIGSVDAIVTQIVAEIPLTKIARERIKPKRRLRAWEIVLLALGSPIWLSLAVAVFAVILSLYAVLWSVIVSVWSVFASLIGGTLGGVASCILFICQGNGLTGFAMISAAAVCAGLSIFLFFGCRAATKGVLLLTKRIVLWIKSRFVRREGI